MGCQLGGGHLGQRVGTCLKALQLGRASPAWLAYVQHVTHIVTKGLCDATLTSLSYLQFLVSSSIRKGGTHH